MARTPETVNIRLHDLLLLLNYRWAATNSKVIGDLGVKCYEDLVAQIEAQSQFEVTPVQLADLIHHMKECVFEQIEPAKMSFSAKNYNQILKGLKRSAPHMFKETATGELQMIELEERVWDL